MEKEVTRFEDLEEAGYCATCLHCRGIDDSIDQCICTLGDSHANWRNNPGDEKCPKWEADAIMCSIMMC